MGNPPPPAPQGLCFSSCLGINVIDQMSMLELEGNLEFVPSFSRWWHCHLWLLPLAFLSQQEEPGRWDFTIAGGLGWTVWWQLSSGLWEKKDFVNPMLLSSSHVVWKMLFTHRTWRFTSVPGEDDKHQPPSDRPFLDSYLNDPFSKHQTVPEGRLGTN